MACAMAWRGVACHGVHDRNPRFKIAQNKHYITADTSFSPRLTSSRSRSSLGHTGFPKGFPIASPPAPPLSGKSHKHPSPPTLLFHQSFSPPVNSSTQPFVSSRNTFLMGLCPRYAKLQVTSLPHFPSPRSPSLNEFACFSL
ncbi:hypothetical protein BC826DRAFT_310038 [Russula brevipes]|nr:hypothetical protein BC826DRAFT_310038 [Russula brevipes]